MNQGAMLITTAVVTGVISILASSGFWTWMMRKDVVRTQNDKLLMGIAYEKIVYMGMGYIDRGWITDDEYHDFRNYLYDPYKALGGNGVTERIMAAVSNLPIRSRAVYAQEVLKVRRIESDEPLDSGAAA